MNEYTLIALLGILAALGIAALCYWLIRSERPSCYEDERLNKTLPAQPRYDVPVLEADSDMEEMPADTQVSVTLDKEAWEMLEKLETMSIWDVLGADEETQEMDFDLSVLEPEPLPPAFEEFFFQLWGKQNEADFGELED